MRLPIKYGVPRFSARVFGQHTYVTRRHKGDRGSESRWPVDSIPCLRLQPNRFIAFRAIYEGETRARVIDKPSEEEEPSTNAYLTTGFAMIW